MFVSRKKIKDMEKKIADLEREVQSQQNEKILKNAMEYCCKMTEKGSSSHPWEEKKSTARSDGCHSFSLDPKAHEQFLNSSGHTHSPRVSDYTHSLGVSGHTHLPNVLGHARRGREMNKNCSLNERREMLIVVEANIEYLSILIDLREIEIPFSVFDEMKRIPEFDIVNEYCRSRCLLEYLRKTNQKAPIVAAPGKNLSVAINKIRLSRWKDVFLL